MNPNQIEINLENAMTIIEEYQDKKYNKRETYAQLVKELKKNRTEVLSDLTVNALKEFIFSHQEDADFKYYWNYFELYKKDGTETNQMLAQEHAGEKQEYEILHVENMTAADVKEYRKSCCGKPSSNGTGAYKKRNLFLAFQRWKLTDTPQPFACAVRFGKEELNDAFFREFEVYVKEQQFCVQYQCYDWLTDKLFIVSLEPYTEKYFSSF